MKDLEKKAFLEGFCEKLSSLKEKRLNHEKETSTSSSLPKRLATGAAALLGVKIVKELFRNPAQHTADNSLGDPGWLRGQDYSPEDDIDMFGRKLTTTF